MRILLCNKFYYRRGGDCIYTLDLEEMLVSKGHQVAVFAMACPENIDSPWSSYFPSMVGLDSKLSFALRSLGDREVRDKFSRILDDFAPDVVHLNNIHSQLSPVIARIAHSRGIRVVWTLHDLKLLCPRYDCLRGGKEPCELCFKNKFNVLRHRCMKNSFAASCLAFAEAMRWNGAFLEENTDLFVCPSRFMMKKMERGGFGKSKLLHLGNAMDVSRCAREDYSERKDYYCYVGRLSHEKGVETLVEAASSLPYRLLVIGDGPLAGKLPARGNIEYLGRRDWQYIKTVVGSARFTVMPSICYENNPLAVIESLCLGTPVLGADIGGIPELIEERVNGLCFESGNAESLASGIREMFGLSFDYVGIARDSCARFSRDSYYDTLVKHVYGLK